MPVTGFSYNVAALTCSQTDGAKCILGSNPAYLSSEAIKLAVQILDTGERPTERSVVVNGDFVTTTPFKSKLYSDANMLQIDVGVNAFPDAAPGLFLASKTLPIGVTR